MTTITFTPTDPRWQRWAVLPKGNVASNIRALPMLPTVTFPSPIVDVLEAGVTMLIGYIPVDALTDAEKVYTHDGTFRWHVVKLVERVGFIRSDVVTLKTVAPPPTPPIFDPPTPPATKPPEAPEIASNPPSDAIVPPPVVEPLNPLRLVVEEILNDVDAQIADAETRLMYLKARREKLAAALAA